MNHLCSLPTAKQKHTKIAFYHTGCHQSHYFIHNLSISNFLSVCLFVNIPFINNFSHRLQSKTYQKIDYGLEAKRCPITSTKKHKHVKKESHVPIKETVGGELEEEASSKLEFLKEDQSRNRRVPLIFILFLSKHRAHSFFCIDIVPL